MQLYNFLQDVEFNEFMTCMKKCVHSCLKQDYRLPNPFADRSVAFVASFCTVVHDHHQKNVDPDTDAPAVTSLVNFLIEVSFCFNLHCALYYQKGTL